MYKYSAPQGVTEELLLTIEALISVPGLYMNKNHDLITNAWSDDGAKVSLENDKTIVELIDELMLLDSNWLRAGKAMDLPISFSKDGVKYDGEIIIAVAGTRDRPVRLDIFEKEDCDDNLVEAMKLMGAIRALGRCVEKGVLRLNDDTIEVGDNTFMEAEATFGTREAQLQQIHDLMRERTKAHKEDQEAVDSALSMAHAVYKLNLTLDNGVLVGGLKLPITAKLLRECTGFQPCFHFGTL